MSDDWIAQQVERNRHEQTNVSIAVGAKSNPGVAARANALARRLDIPADVVERNLSEIEQRDRTIKQARVVQQAPRSFQEWMGNPRNAAAAGDDVPTLASLAHTAAPWTPGRGPSANMGQGLPKYVAPTLGNYVSGVWHSVTGGFKQMAGGALEQFIDNYDPNGPDPVTGRVRSMPGRDLTAALPIARRLSAQGQQEAQDATPDFQTSGAKGVFSGVSSFAQQFPALVLSLATRNPAPSLAMAGAQTGFTAYGDYRRNGSSVAQANVGSLGQAAVEIGTELLPLSHYINAFTGAGKGFARELGISMLEEQVGEQVATHAQDALDTALTPNKSWSDYWAGRGEAAAQTAIATLTQSVIGAALPTAAHLTRQKAEAHLSTGILDAVMADAEAAKLREADPEAFHQYVAGLSENTPIENVFIPAAAIRELMQDGMAEHPAFAPHMAQIEEALALDGDVVLPLADVATHLAGTPEWAVLRKEARLTPGGMSEAELGHLEKTFKDGQEERMTQAASAAAEAAAPAARVFDDVYRQLVDAGQTPQNAAKYATLWAAQREATGKRMGQDAWAYHEANPVRFRNDAVQPEGRALDQEIDTPAFKAWFGDSKVVDAEGNPAVFYHGSLAGFDAFHPNSHFGTADQANVRVEGLAGLPDYNRERTWRTKASQQPNVTPVYLNIRNPKRIADELDEDKMRAAIRRAKAEGYDGVVYRNEGEKRSGADEAFDSWVAFEPAQVKSAISNVGTYDPNDPRIRYQGETSDGRGRTNDGDRAPLANAPTVDGKQFGPIAELVDAAHAYAEAQGITLTRQSEYVKADPEFGKRIADAYEAMPHAPNDPTVRDAYADLIAQSRAQYDAAVAHGFTFEFGDPDSDYFLSGWNSLRDLRDNKRMLVFPTVAGFGSDATFDAADNPLLALTDLTWTDHTGAQQPVYANDLFRAVHDAFGHGLEGAGFRADGEENAWLAHAQLFHGPALAALTTETRGQNSWLNFGPYGEANQTASIADTHFADQKTGLMPSWTWAAGRSLEQAYLAALASGEVAGVDPEGHGTVGWTAERIDDLLRQYGYGHDPERTKAYAVRLSPEQFLGLTASESGRAQIENRVGLDEYEQGEINFDRMRGNSQAPFILAKVEGGFATSDGTVVPKTLRAIGHEGRHRMTMLKNAGVVSVPIIIVTESRNDPPTTGTMTPQRSRSDQLSTGDTHAAFENMQPISYANREGLQAEFGQGRVLFQSDPFYSALERAVEGVQTKRAPASQWLATLKKAPGVKQEELEWTGLEEWLNEQTVPVEKDAVLNAVRQGAITVEENELGGYNDYDYDIDNMVQEREEQLSEQFANDWEPQYVVVETDEDIDGNPLDEKKWAVEDRYGNREDEGGLFDSEDDAQERMWELDDEQRSEAKQEYIARNLDRDEIAKEFDNSEYRSHSLVPDGDDSYRELLLYFPFVGYDVGPGEAMDGGGRANRTKAQLLHNDAPSTHWSAEQAVVAHARYHDRRGPNGERILFLDEIQSDWHQQGREQGYNEPADPETQEKARKALAEATDELNKRDEELRPFVEKLHLALRPIAEALASHLRTLDRYKLRNNPERDINEATHHLSLADRNPGDLNADELRYFYSDIKASMGLVRPEVTDVDGVAKLEGMAALLADATEAMKEISDPWEARRDANRTYDLRDTEHRLAAEGGNIPNAPFKNTWPMLVMKRLIVKAASEGYDQIAWIKQGENNGGMNDNVGWFYEKVLPNETNKLLKKYGTKVEGLKVNGLKAAETERAKAIYDELADAAKAAGGMQRYGYLPNEDEAKTEYDQARAKIEDEMTKRRTRLASLREERAGASDADLRADQVEALDRRVFEEESTIEHRQNLLDATADWPTVWAAAQRHTALEQELESEKKNAPTNLGFKISDQLRDAASEGFALFQGGQQPRGRVSGGLISNQPGPHLIELFDGSDLSTVIHETAHVWLEELRRDAASDSAPQQVKDDWAEVERWFGENGHAVNEIIPTDAHELWARGFERYAMEGKSPSSALGRVFDAFRSWLLTIYKHVANLNSPITPEIRAVFDRMLATQEEIEQAADHQGIEARFKNAEQAGMTAEGFAAYRQLADDARSEAFDALLYRTMSTIRRERTKAFVEERRRVEGDVTAQVNDRPEFRALHLLYTGRWLDDPEREPMKVRLDEAWLKERFGDDIVSRLPKGKPITAENGDDVDTIANLTGFTSGEDMVRALIALAEAKAALKESGDKSSVKARTIADEVSRVMTERHGDPLNDGSIEEEALAAIHTDKQGELIASENRQLAKQTRNQATPLSLAKEWARRKIAEGRVNDVASRSAIQRYARAHAKASKVFEAALAEQNVEEAFRQSESRLLNHVLIAEAKRAAERIEKSVERLTRTAKARKRPTVDQDYYDRALALLEKFEFRPRSQKALDEMEAFASWAEKQAANGIDIITPPRLEADGVHYTRMTVEELIGLDDSVTQLLHIGRRKKKLMDAAEQREFDEVIDEAVSVVDGIPQKVSNNRLNPSKFDRLKNRIASADAALLKMEQVFDWLDAGNSNGAFNRFVFRPIAAAQTRARDMMGDYLGQIRTLMLAVPKEQLKRWEDKITTPLLNRETGEPFEFTKQDLISMALNVGNEGNFDKLAGGYGWNRETVMDTLDTHLTPEEWGFVQGVWDMVNTLWPQIEALEKRVNGVAPEKVEARSFTLASGTQMRGGYYPVVYDPLRNYQTEALEAVDASKLFNNGYQRATTRQGHAKERTDVQRPIQLSLSVLNRHLTGVIHDITHREVIMEADRFLSDRRIVKAVDNSVGREIRKQFRPWLSHIANEFAIDNRGLDGIEALAKRLRTSSTIIGMGFRLTTILAQPAGYAGVAEVIGTRWLASGMKAASRDPVGSFDFVMERSDEIRHRMDTMERDIDANLKEMQGKRGMLANVRRFAFHGIGYMDRVVVIPAWLGAYNKGMSEGMTEADAAYYADKIARSSQGSGGAKDLSALQRGGEFMKLATMFYSYASAFYNRQRNLGRDTKRALSEKDIAAFPGLLARAWWLMVVSPLMSQLPGILLSGAGPDEDKDETWLGFILGSLLANQFYGVPIFRDIASSATTGFKYSFTPASRMIETMLKAGGDVFSMLDFNEDTGPSKKAVKTGIEAVGYAGRLPVGQVANAAQFIVDWANGDANPDGVKDWLEGLQRGKLDQ